MNVKDSRLWGMLLGIPFGYAPRFVDIAENFQALNLVLGVTFILTGWRIKGTTGGLFAGFGVGISIGYFMQTIS